MMKYPPHPAEMLEDILLSGYGLTLEQSAKMLGISATTLSNLFAKKTKIGLNLAYRLGIAGISNARFWLALQSNYDLAQFINAKTKEPKIDVEKFAEIRRQIKRESEMEESRIDEFTEKRIAERISHNLKNMHRDTRIHQHRQAI